MDYWDFAYLGSPQLDASLLYADLAVLLKTDRVDLALVCAGCGIGFAQRAVASRNPDIVEIPLEFALPRLPVWFTSHAAIRPMPRVRRVWTLLEAGLRAILDSGPE